MGVREEREEVGRRWSRPQARGSVSLLSLSVPSHSHRTGMRSGYLSRMRAASAWRFSACDDGERSMMREAGVGFSFVRAGARTVALLLGCLSLARAQRAHRLPPALASSPWADLT